MTTPRDLMYSQAVKPVSIASTAQTRKFLPITSGTYTPTSNNIIRVPINANAFVDLKNAMLRYKLGSTTANTGVQLDGSAGSIISRLNVLGPDGAPLETIDNYNRLYQALSALERSRDNYAGICNALEGCSALAQTRYSIIGTSGVAFDVLVDGKKVGAITLDTANQDIRFGNYRITSDATNTQVWYRGTPGTQITNATAKSASGAGGLVIQVVTTDVEYTINGQTLAAGSRHEWTDVDYTARTQSEVQVASADGTAQTGARYYSHNLLSCLTKLDVLYPAFAVGGGGIVIEITLAPAQEVLQSCQANTVLPTYAVSDVELIAPVIQYPENVIQSFKQMVQAQGSVSMSSVSFQNFIYPISAAATSVSIPLAMRARSLKALYFFFQPNSSSTNYSYPRSSARESPLTMSYQLRVGSQYFPASLVQYSTTTGAGGIAEAVIELEKSVSKLSDIRHGSVLNADNFILPQVFGGTSIFGIDLEASAISFLENGVNTSDNSLTMYLELTNLTFTTQVAEGTTAGTSYPTPTLQGTAGNVYIYAMFDNTLSILPNGNVIMTK